MGLVILVGFLAVGSQVAASPDTDSETAAPGDLASYAAPTLVGDDGAAARTPFSPGLPDHLAVPIRPTPAAIDAIIGLDETPSLDPRSVALDAYRAAAREWPGMGCRGRWSILAAIGHVESSHGGAAGPEVVVRDDGVVTPEIFGPVLDGGDYAVVEDTDGGRLDGDATYDRAVGPMQFMPATWNDHQQDGNGDGVADPHNLYDAALAAANYLCTARTGNLNDEAVLTVALHAYNQSEEYVLLVLDLIDWYDTGRMGTRTAGGVDGAPTIEPAVPFDLAPSVLAVADADADAETVELLSTSEDPTPPRPPETTTTWTTTRTGRRTTTSTTTSTTTTTTTVPIPTTIWMEVVDLTVAETNDPGPRREWAELWIDQTIGIDVEFAWEATSASATADDDFVAASGQAVIVSGTRNVSLPVDIIGDELVEGDEQFIVQIRPVTPGLQFTDGDRVTVTIVDDDTETTVAS